MTYRDLIEARTGIRMRIQVKRNLERDPKYKKETAKYIANLQEVEQRIQAEINKRNELARNAVKSGVISSTEEALDLLDNIVDEQLKNLTLRVTKSYVA